MEALQAVNLGMIGAYAVPLVVSPKAMLQQLYPKETPSDATVLATRGQGIALCQIVCLYGALSATGALKNQATRNAVHAAMSINYGAAAVQSEIARSSGCDNSVATATTLLMAGMAGYALRTLVKETRR